jgi:hypothetical protein
VAARDLGSVANAPSSMGPRPTRQIHFAMAVDPTCGPQYRWPCQEDHCFLECRAALFSSSGTLQVAQGHRAGVDEDCPGRGRRGQARSRRRREAVTSSGAASCQLGRGAVACSCSIQNVQRLRESESRILGNSKKRQIATIIFELKACLVGDDIATRHAPPV